MQYHLELPTQHNYNTLKFQPARIWRLFKNIQIQFQNTNFTSQLTPYATLIPPTNWISLIIFNISMPSHQIWRVNMISETYYIPKAVLQIPSKINIYFCFNLQISNSKKFQHLNFSRKEHVLKSHLNSLSISFVIYFYFYISLLNFMFC